MGKSNILIKAENLISFQRDYNLELIGPVRGDPSWQTRNHPKFAASNFKIDWEEKVAICPKGQQSTTWKEKKDRGGQPIIQITFSRLSCNNCSSRSRCTRSKIEPRGLTIRDQNEYLALKNRREVQNTREFQDIYRKRAGIEGTLSQGVRKSGLRQSRYVGLAKTHLQHIFTAVAINLSRLDNWLNEIPLASTRYSRFCSLKSKPS